jgi:hypothetical protein
MLWITNLRGRLDRGELAALAPVDLGYGSLPVERTVRIMLSELDDFADVVPDEADVARQASLLVDFRLLRYLLD